MTTFNILMLEVIAYIGIFCPGYEKTMHAQVTIYIYDMDRIFIILYFQNVLLVTFEKGLGVNCVLLIELNHNLEIPMSVQCNVTSPMLCIINSTQHVAPTHLDLITLTEIIKSYTNKRKTSCMCKVV